MLNIVKIFLIWIIITTQKLIGTHHYHHLNHVNHKLENLSNDDLAKISYIRNEGHTVIECINRQLCHYSYHIGQIVMIGKTICDKKWKTLSIPKGESEHFNALKFSKEKKPKNFLEK